MTAPDIKLIRGALRGSLIRASDGMRPKPQPIRNVRRGHLRPYAALVSLYDRILQHDHTGASTQELLGGIDKLRVWVEERERFYWPQRNRPAA